MAAIVASNISVIVLDKIDLQTRTNATIVLLEEDNEINGLFYAYLVAENKSLNTQYDPKIGYYWDITVFNNNPYLQIRN